MIGERFGIFLCMFYRSNFLLNKAFCSSAYTVNSFKMCFPNAFKNYTLCRLGCQQEDSIAHAFTCEELGSQSEVQHRDIFSMENKQREVVLEFTRRFQVRSALLAARASQGHQILDTSTRAAAGGAGGRARGTTSFPMTASCE